MKEQLERKSLGGGQLVSIIVPVYKVEPYLRCCIDSILAQTYTDFELILIDDGSPDNCGVICDEYAEKDERIVVIHQENKGVSAARNAGIDWAFANSNSRWITFVDSDDALPTRYLDTLYQWGRRTEAEIVATDSTRFVMDQELCDFKQQAESCEILDGKSCCVPYFDGTCEVSPYPWGKLCKKELFSEIRFSVGVSYKEDEEVIGKLIYLAKTIAVIRGGLYFYRNQPESVSNERFSLNRYGHLRALDSCILFFAKNSEEKILDSIYRRKTQYMAKYILLARGSGVVEQVPPEYRMSTIKACYIVGKDTFSRGGMNFVRERLRNYFRRVNRT